jgi:hypothetical protein
MSPELGKSHAPNVFSFDMFLGQYLEKMFSGQHHIINILNTRGMAATGAQFTVHTSQDGSPGRAPGLAQAPDSDTSKTDQAGTVRPCMHAHTNKQFGVPGVQERHGHKSKQKPCSPRGRETVNPIQYHAPCTHAINTNTASTCPRAHARGCDLLFLLRFLLSDGTVISAPPVSGSCIIHSCCKSNPCGVASAGRWARSIHFFDHLKRALSSLFSKGLWLIVTCRWPTCWCVQVSWWFLLRSRVRPWSMKRDCKAVC